MKLKTNSGAKKRFSSTGKNHLTRKKATHRHKLVKKTSKNKRLLRQTILLTRVDQQNVRKLLPYI